MRVCDYSCPFSNSALAVEVNICLVEIKYYVYFTPAPVSPMNLLIEEPRHNRCAVNSAMFCVQAYPVSVVIQ